MAHIRNDFEQLLDTYFHDPLALKELVTFLNHSRQAGEHRFHSIALPVALERPPAIGFEVEQEEQSEEDDGEVYSLRQLEKSDEERNLENLRKAITRLVKQTCEEHDLASPLLGFHILLFQRLQIIQEVYSSQKHRTLAFKSLKSGFEVLPLYMKKNFNEESSQVLRQLSKALQKSDDKRGLFSRIRKSRSEAVYRILTKHTDPMSMYGEDMSQVREYLVAFVKGQNQPRKRRTKAVASLFLFALTKGSLTDMLEVLLCLLSFSPDQEPLSSDNSEDGGFLVRAEMTHALQRFDNAISNTVPKIDLSAYENRKFTPMTVLNDPELNLDDGEIFSLRTVFISILARLDYLAFSFLCAGPSILRHLSKASSVNISYVVEAIPTTFNKLVSILEILLSVGVGSAKTAQTQEQKDSYTYFRVYSITACLRILRINIEILSLWRREHETLADFENRLTKNNEDNGFILSLKSFLLKVLEDPTDVTPTPSPLTRPTRSQRKKESKKPEEDNIETIGSVDDSGPSSLRQRGGSGKKNEDEAITNISDISDEFVVIKRTASISDLHSPYPIPESEVREICMEVASTVCAGFTLFYPSHEEQVDFFLQSLRSVHLPLRRTILHHLLNKILEDSYLFDSFVVKGLSTKLSSVDFIMSLVSFCFEATSTKIQNLAVDTAQTDTHVDEICQLCLKLALLWQNHLIVTVNTGGRDSGDHLQTVVHYTSQLVALCEKMITTTSAILPNVTHEANNGMIETALKESFVGWLLMPLVQGFIWLLWNPRKGGDKTVLERVAPILVGFLPGLMASVNNLATMLAHSDEHFDWTIVETDHPYACNLEEKIKVSFPDAIAVAIQFDKRFRTEPGADELTVCDGENMPGSFRDFSGAEDAVPLEPLLSYSKDIYFKFRSNDQKTDWGAKCSVIPIRLMTWIYELERSLSWIGSRLATWMMVRIPISPKEVECSLYLESPLFSNGLEDEETQIINTYEEEFLQDLIHCRNEAEGLAKHMGRVVHEQNILHNNDLVLECERSLVSAMLKHLGVTPLAMKFTRAVIEKNDVTVPSILMQIWRVARRIRMWIIGKRQREQLSYEDIHQRITSKTHLLLSLNSWSGVQLSDSSLVSDNPDSPDTGAYSAWKQFKQSNTTGSEQSVEMMTKKIMSFVQSNADAKHLKQYLLRRKDRAASRVESFNFIAELLSSTQFPSIQAELINGAVSALRSDASQLPKTPHFHYLHNTEGCEVSTASLLSTAFTKFLARILPGLQGSGDSYATGILRSTLDALMISFLPSDVDWILSQGLLSLLCPLMYQSEVEENLNKPFHKRSFVSEEQNQLKSRAWRIFRMLSIRCVEMIESWHTFKDRVPLGEEDVVREKLETLRDQIFGLLFDELEAITQQTSVHARILEEMLSLMNSLCSSKSARKCLSNARFQRLLLPLLTSGVPRVQTLSLDLCSQLVLSQPDKASVDFQTVCEHVEVLFSFLGACELSNILGTQMDSSNANSISLPMARDIFVLLRTLLEQSTGAWKEAILRTMDTSLYNLYALLDHAKELGPGVLSTENIAKLKASAAALVLINGFSYVPQNGEKVKILHNGQWQRGKVLSTDEPRHHMNVLFERRPRNIVKVSSVPAENIIPLTQEPINLSSLAFDPSSVNELCSFAIDCGTMLERFNLHKSLKQLFSFFWVCSLRTLNIFLNDALFYEQIVTPERVNYFAKFSQKQTNLIYGKFPKIDSCTYVYSGPTAKKQTYFNCKTCKMKTAICPFCIRQCHYGHSISGPFIGEVYCHCGSGEAPQTCTSANSPQEQSPLVLERMETMALRLRNLVPLYEKQKSGTAQLASRDSSSEIGNYIPARFITVDEKTGYSMSTFNAEVSFSWSTASGFSFLGTQKPVSLKAGYYFEVEVINLGTPAGIALGFSKQVNTHSSWPQVLSESFTLHADSGALFEDTNEITSDFMQPAQPRDIIGCGFNKATNTIFFTKNGTEIGTGFENFNEQECYPVILLRGEGATVRPNLGSKFFKFVHSFSRDSVRSDPLTPSHDESNSADDISKQVAELASLGYSTVEAKTALYSSGMNINAAAIKLQKSQSQPVRDAIASQLQDMGFERPMCIKALKLNDDDINTALTWLIEHGSESVEDSSEDEIEDEDHGMCFLGANANEANLKNAMVDTITECFDPPVDEAFIYHVRLSPQMNNNILVINPALATKGTNPNLKQVAGNLCVVVKQSTQGALIETIEPESGEFFSCFLDAKDLLLPPAELRAFNITSVKNEVVKIHSSMSTLYARRIFGKIVRNWPNNREMPQQFFSSGDLFATLKVLFLEHLHYQSTNFLASEPYLTDQIKSLQHSAIKTRIGGIPLFRYLLPPAIKELEEFKAYTSNYRKECFSRQIISKMQPVRFWGASAICVNFSPLCELPGSKDVLTFYFDPLGRKIAKQIKGPLAAESFPRWVVIPGDRFWYQFQTEYVREGAGFQFFVTPYKGILHEKLALKQPALPLACWVLHNATRVGPLDTREIHDIWDKGLKYSTIPFAPFKGTVADALIRVVENLGSVPIQDRPSLALLIKFRKEFEPLCLKHQASEIGFESPTFYRLVEFMANARKLLKSDLCTTIFGATQLNHLYQFSNVFDQSVTCCPSCAVVIDAYNKPPRYKCQEKSPCQTRTANVLEWAQEPEQNNLVPIEKLNVNPSDWFEHSNWVDQLSIVQQVLGCIVLNKPFPEWFLYDIALQLKQKIVYKESTHPYTVINDSGEVRFPGARTLYISFDKHSKTHKSERLFFSKKRIGGNDLGSFGGDELKDRLITVHSSKLYYSFASLGDDHECQCRSCNAPIHGIRYRCTLCDNVDLCQNCINKPGVHDERHIFLKIRRAVDCVPAALPNLYTNKWIGNPQFRSNVHAGVKCEACGMFPIRGVRYWCENCENYNLCEHCAKHEYKHHNRMHVFLRVVRPLPPKSQLPANALPYGLVYEKDLDTHWGYLFSVSSADTGLKLDGAMRKLLGEISDSMHSWNRAMDAQLVQYIEQYCDGWQSLDPWKLNPSRSQLLHFPLLNNARLDSIRYRFTMLKLINRRISRVLCLLDLSDGKRRANSLPSMVSLIRDRIFKSVKMDVWSNTVDPLLTNQNPVYVKLNRHKASEQYENPLRKANNTLFNQGFRQLFYISPELLKRKKSCFKVNFVGEAADDYGGPFREALSQMCDELQEDSLPVLIRVPNGTHSVGLNREKFMPNPAASSPFYLKWFQFMGLVMAIGLLSKNILPLDLPPMFWKLLVNEKLDGNDLEAVDHLCYQFISTFRNAESEGITDEVFDDTFEQYFTTHTADGEEVELIPGGASKRVRFQDRLRFAKAVERFRLNEVQPHLEAVKKGVFSLIPPRYFPLLTWKEMEMMVCGNPEIDMELLKKHTIYEGLNANSRLAKDFWHVFESFNTTERSLFLKFIWGRSRLPVSEEAFTQPMKVQKVDRSNPDNYLPLSHTCFFSIELPNYSSRQILKDKLLYAITHCQAIDTDATAAANEARNSDWSNMPEDNEGY